MNRLLAALFFGSVLVASQEPQGGTFKADVYKVGGPVSAPTPLYRREPHFPRGMRPTTRSVTVSAIVGVDGRPQSPSVVHSGGHEFDAAVLEALTHWIFKPAMKAGKPVPVKIQIDFDFQNVSGDWPPSWEEEFCDQKMSEGWAAADNPVVADMRSGCMALWDENKAAKYFEKAADAGLLPAQVMMAGLHLHGRGVKKNKVDALKWIRIAQASGSKDASAYAQEVEPKLKPDEIAKAEIAAKDWLNSHPGGVKK